MEISFPSQFSFYFFIYTYITPMVTWMKLKCNTDGLVIAWCLLSNLLREEHFPPRKFTSDVHIRRSQFCAVQMYTFRQKCSFRLVLTYTSGMGERCLKGPVSWLTRVVSPSIPNGEWFGHILLIFYPFAF